MHQGTRAPEHLIIYKEILKESSLVLAPEHQGSRAGGQEGSKAAGNQCTSAPEHQCTRAPGHQRTKAAGQQGSRAPVHQGIRAPGHQAHLIICKEIFKENNLVEEILEDL